MIESAPLVEDSDSDATIAILAAFLELWESAPEQERESIVKEHCDRHPEIADEFRSLVAAWRTVSDAKGPEQLGPYRIIRVLAVGGMGKVYEAEDQVLSRRVAVKTIRHGRLADPKLLERFLAEREALALLHHTNIVPIYGAVEDSGLLYFAMPLLEGFALADLVNTSRGMSFAARSAGSTSTWEEFVGRATSEASRARYCRRVVASLGQVHSMEHSAASPSSPIRGIGPSSSFGLPRDYRRRVVEVMALAADAIHSAHEAGVLHRDLKPSNIQIESVSGAGQPTTHPWVLDFGLAYLRRTNDQSNAPENGAPGDPARLSHTDRPTEGMARRATWLPNRCLAPAAR
jgi:serine/threonine protein kinase